MASGSRGQAGGKPHYCLWQLGAHHAMELHGPQFSLFSASSELPCWDLPTWPCVIQAPSSWFLATSEDHRCSGLERNLRAIGPMAHTGQETSYIFSAHWQSKLCFHFCFESIPLIQIHFSWHWPPAPPVCYHKPYMLILHSYAQVKDGSIQHGDPVEPNLWWHLF